jgi:hypothetical protein
VRKAKKQVALHTLKRNELLNKRHKQLSAHAVRASIGDNDVDSFIADGRRSMTLLRRKKNFQMLESRDSSAVLPRTCSRVHCQREYVAVTLSHAR